MLRSYPNLMPISCTDIDEFYWIHKSIYTATGVGLQDIVSFQSYADME